MSSKASKHVSGKRRLLSFCLLGLLVAGCHSPSKPPSARFASVELAGNTPGQITRVAEEVFHENGFKATRVAPDKLMFEKKASAWNNLAYGGWVDATQVWLRVQASVVPIGEARFRLECHAFEVRDRGATLEDELSISNLRAGPYRKMLDEVARRLTGSQVQPPFSDLPAQPQK